MAPSLPDLRRHPEIAGPQARGPVTKAKHSPEEQGCTSAKRIVVGLARLLTLARLQKPGSKKGRKPRGARADVAERSPMPVCPYGRNRIGKVFRKASREGGLHGADCHALGGWKTERMMRRYAAVTDATLRAAAEAVSGNEPWQLSGKPAISGGSR
jgi:hypothetical protein